MMSGESSSFGRGGGGGGSVGESGGVAEGAGAFVSDCARALPVTKNADTVPMQSTNAAKDAYAWFLVMFVAVVR